MPSQTEGDRQMQHQLVVIAVMAGVAKLVAEHAEEMSDESACEDSSDSDSYQTSRKTTKLNNRGRIVKRQSSRNDGSKRLKEGAAKLMEAVNERAREIAEEMRPPHERALEVLWSKQFEDIDIKVRMKAAAFLVDNEWGLAFIRVPERIKRQLIEEWATEEGRAKYTRS